LLKFEVRSSKFEGKNELSLVISSFEIQTARVSGFMGSNFQLRTSNFEAQG